MKKKTPSPELAPSNSEILLYTTQDRKQRIEVRLENETVWLSQLAMTELFQTTKQNISLHLKNIFAEGELSGSSVVKEYLTTAADKKAYKTKLYRLEAIIAVGYRVKSHHGTQFRQWATQRLSEYIVKGFTIDAERLSEPGGLLNRNSAFKATISRLASLRFSCPPQFL